MSLYARILLRSPATTGPQQPKWQDQRRSAAIYKNRKRERVTWLLYNTKPLFFSFFFLFFPFLFNFFVWAIHIPPSPVSVARAFHVKRPVPKWEKSELIGEGFFYIFFLHRTSAVERRNLKLLLLLLFYIFFSLASGGGGKKVGNDRFLHMHYWIKLICIFTKFLLKSDIHIGL